MRHDESAVEYVTEAIFRLMPFAYAITGHRQDAEDLLQESLTTVLVKWRRVGDARDKDAYTRRIMVNTFMSSRRKRSAGEVPSDRMREGAVAARTGEVDDRDRIVRLLQCLPPKQRLVLVLRYMVDLPDDQIAEYLGCRTGSVRVMSSRGLAALREHTSDQAVV